MFVTDPHTPQQDQHHRERSLALASGAYCLSLKGTQPPHSSDSSPISDEPSPVPPGIVDYGDRGDGDGAVSRAVARYPVEPPCDPCVSFSKEDVAENEWALDSARKAYEAEQSRLNRRLVMQQKHFHAFVTENHFSDTRIKLRCTRTVTQSVMELLAQADRTKLHVNVNDFLFTFRRVYNGNRAGRPVQTMIHTLLESVPGPAILGHLYRDIALEQKEDVLTLRHGTASPAPHTEHCAPQTLLECIVESVAHGQALAHDNLELIMTGNPVHVVSPMALERVACHIRALLYSYLFRIPLVAGHHMIVALFIRSCQNDFLDVSRGRQLPVVYLGCAHQRTLSYAQRRPLKQLSTHARLRFGPLRCDKDIDLFAGPRLCRHPWICDYPLVVEALAIDANGACRKSLWTSRKLMNALMSRIIKARHCFLNARCPSVDVLESLRALTAMAAWVYDIESDETALELAYILGSDHGHHVLEHVVALLTAACGRLPALTNTALKLFQRLLPVQFPLASTRLIGAHLLHDHSHLVEKFLPALYKAAQETLLNNDVPIEQRLSMRSQTAHLVRLLLDSDCLQATGKRQALACLQVLRQDESRSVLNGVALRNQQLAKRALEEERVLLAKVDEVRQRREEEAYRQRVIQHQQNVEKKKQLEQDRILLLRAPRAPHFSSLAASIPSLFPQPPYDQYDYGEYCGISRRGAPSPPPLRHRGLPSGNTNAKRRRSLSWAPNGVDNTNSTTCSSVGRAGRSGAPEEPPNAVSLAPEPAQHTHIGLQDPYEAVEIDTLMDKISDPKDPYWL